MSGPGLSRIALGVEYDGSDFHGWQAQQGVRTVQSCLEKALSRVANHAVRVHCAGRTDRGVHALQQVVHFDTHAVRSERSWVLGATVNLPSDVAIVWAKPVPHTFHARFCATGRHYRYIIANRLTRPVIQHRRQVWCHRPLDVLPMQQAAGHLVGEHDFSSFRAKGCQAKSPVRRVTRLDVIRQAELVIMEVSANGFLHHMVRNMAGVLMAIGRGDQPVDWVKQLLEHRDRSLGGVTAPPEGLYLVGVAYPLEFSIPVPAWPQLRVS